MRQFFLAAFISTGTDILLTLTLSYDMYKDVEESLAKQRQASFTDKYIHGLPIGLKMSNGVTIGE